MTLPANGYCSHHLSLRDECPQCKEIARLERERRAVEAQSVRVKAWDRRTPWVERRDVALFSIRNKP